MTNLEGKNILITGGSLGIGKATAEILIKAGANVMITGRNKDRLRKAAAEIGAEYFVADVSGEEDIKDTYKAFFNAFKRLDCLINNAGIGRGAELTEFSAKEMDEVFAVNVRGAALMAKEAAKVFKKQMSGDIINISSSSGVKGHAGGTVYCGSKFALRGMTECWRAELRPFNVRVMLINPSEVATAFGKPDRKERKAAPNKLSTYEIAHAIKAVLEMDKRGFIPELGVWATNPW